MISLKLLFKKLFWKSPATDPEQWAVEAMKNGGPIGNMGLGENVLLPVRPPKIEPQIIKTSGIIPDFILRLFSGGFKGGTNAPPTIPPPPPPKGQGGSEIDNDIEAIRLERKRAFEKSWLIGPTPSPTPNVSTATFAANPYMRIPVEEAPIDFISSPVSVAPYSVEPTPMISEPEIKLGQLGQRKLDI